MSKLIPIERETAESICEELKENGFNTYIKEDRNYIIIENAENYWGIFDMVEGNLPLDEYLLSPTRKGEITIQKVKKR